ncbi:hypothetical protein FKW77_004308 [Venturia effusa]|uniref:FAS1 domain-containing protein n=1 Tax=Venturia effusa TaxID=50376 RepID=A0A517LNR5_9PEZI|nr:hypothetical protein FKW77_004308 [Venturia effusa]
MCSSTLFSQVVLFLISFSGLSTACLPESVGSTVNQNCQEVTCYPPPGANDDPITVLGTTNTNKKRDVWDPIDRNNATWPREEYAYQVSPYYKPAAVLRECSGSVVTSFDTIHANLEGRGQTWVSQRNYSEPCCTNSTPIRLISGGGAVSIVLEADIPFPGGILHIVDKLLTTPTKLSTTLRDIAPAAFNKLINGFRAYDNIPSSTFFIPSDTALANSCSYTLAAGQARTLINAQSVKGVVAYSPTLVDGAFFKSGNGEDITITVKADGTKFANGIKIVRQDIIVENGVVHIIDGLFSSPETSCAGPSTSQTVTVISTIYQQSVVYQPGPTISQGTNCPPAPTSTVYSGSCIPATTTVFTGQETKCLPAIQTPSSSYRPEDCDENGVPYGPGHPRPVISAMMQGIGGYGSSTPNVPATPTGTPAYSGSAASGYGGNPGGFHND